MPDLDQALAGFTAQLQINPHQRGLTGLPTWLWVAGDDTATWSQVGAAGLDADCSEVPAPIVDFTATVERWVITVSGEHDNAVHRAHERGTEDDPAAVQTFDYVDHYELTLSAVLAGDVEATVDLDQRDYTVVEIRSRLTD